MHETVQFNEGLPVWVRILENSQPKPELPDHCGQMAIAESGGSQEVTRDSSGERDIHSPTPKERLTGLTAHGAP